VEDMYIPNSDVLTDEVEVDLNMFGALMLDIVGGEFDHADIIAVDQSGS
jgi:hypothetical protein